MPCHSLYTWYSQVQETKGEAEKITGQRDRKEVVREGFLEEAIFELGFKNEECNLFRLKERVEGRVIASGDLEECF